MDNKTKGIGILIVAVPAAVFGTAVLLLVSLGATPKQAVGVIAGKETFSALVVLLAFVATVALFTIGIYFLTKKKTT
jgi:hypothetical protein